MILIFYVIICFMKVINVLKCLAMHKSHYNYIYRFFILPMDFMNFTLLFYKVDKNYIFIVLILK